MRLPISSRTAASVLLKRTPGIWRSRRNGRARRSGAGSIRKADSGLRAADGQAVEEVPRGLDHRPAHLANEMPVGLRGQVVDGGTVPEVGVDDHSEPLELVEVPVDRRDVNVGGDGPGPRLSSSSAGPMREPRRTGTANNSRREVVIRPP